jgi:hypothetical protein
MTDETTATQEGEGQEPSAPQGQEPNSNAGQAPANPPAWGDDFTPERAYNTIQAQRAELREANLRTRNLEREGLSELERLKAERDDAVKELQASTLETMRHQVLAAKGLPATALQILKGDTKEELESNADVLKAMIGQQPQGQPDFGAGARPNGNGHDDDGDFSKMIRRAAGRSS